MDVSALFDWALTHPLAHDVTPRRLHRVCAVAARRLTSVTIVLENLADPHNVAAVVRSAEGFGIDAVHVVEQPNRYERNPSISRGADRWVRIERHERMALCLGTLSSRGFTVVAADVGAGCLSLPDLPIDRPLAFVFGSEREGLSRRARGLIDERFTIPMVGFTESFNVSVSAAIALYDATTRRRRALGNDTDLDEGGARERVDAYLRRAVRNPRLVARRDEEGRSDTEPSAPTA